MNASEYLLLPQPKELTVGQGTFGLPENGYIVIRSDVSNDLLQAAQRLRREAGCDWRITAADAGDPTENVAVLACDADFDMPDEDYALDVDASGITVRASSPAGVYHGVCTVCQLIAQFGRALPFVHIRDWPDFPVRGVMLDVSRDKVPTLDTLMDLVELLAGWKINQVQLYTEHTFAYRGHEVVWENASPMTPEEILLLDRYCAERFVELVPNQNSFGHMERWFEHEKYRSLAEAPNGFRWPWGGWEEVGFTLCPSDPGSLALLSDLYDQLLPHFTSRLFNVGLDETFDLGQGRSKQECDERGVGRVYLDFLLKIHELVADRDHTMLFWGDIMMHHPELIDELPKDTIALEWGYEANHPFAEDGSKFREACIPFWVCPGTSSWNSIAGRTNNCLGNLSNAAVNGLAAGATGFLNTDWGDHGHWQYLPISYIGFLYGAAASWNSCTVAGVSFTDALSLQAFADSTGTVGRAVFDMGNAYELIAKKPGNCTVLWQQLSRPMDDLSVVDGVTADELERAAAVAEAAKNALTGVDIRRADAELVLAELRNAADMLTLAARLGAVRLATKNGADMSGEKTAAAKQLAAIISEHERLWLARNKPGGLSDSVTKLRVRLDELKGR